MSSFVIHKPAIFCTVPVEMVCNDEDMVLHVRIEIEVYGQRKKQD